MLSVTGNRFPIKKFEKKAWKKFTTNVHIFYRIALYNVPTPARNRVGLSTHGTSKGHTDTLKKTSIGKWR